MLSNARLAGSLEASAALQGEHTDTTEWCRHSAGSRRRAADRYNGLLGGAVLRPWRDGRRSAIREASDLLGKAGQKSSAFSIGDSLEMNAVSRLFEHEWWINAEELAWFKETTL